MSVKYSRIAHIELCYSVYARYRGRALVGPSYRPLAGLQCDQADLVLPPLVVVTGSCVSKVQRVGGVGRVGQ